jgi:hypothetical protein
MPQQAELQRFVTQPGSQAPAPAEGTLTRRQLRELTSASETATDEVAAPAEPAPYVPAAPAPVYEAPAPAFEPVAPVVEPERPAHVPAHAAAPIVVPSAAPGTPFGDVAVMPTYGTPVTPPAAAAAPAPSTQVSTYSAPPAAAPAVNPYSAPPVAPPAAQVNPYSAPPAVAPANPYSGLASPALIPQVEPAAAAPAPFTAAAPPANPFAAAPAPANPFAAAAPAPFVAPANPFAAPVDVAPANPFAAASNPFATTSFAQGNPFAAPTAFAPTEFSTTAAPAFSFDFEPVVATESSRSYDDELPVQTGGIWFFSLVPLIQAGLMYLVFVTLATEPILTTTGGLAVLPVLLYLLAADKDKKKLDSLGHDRLTGAGWALLPLVFMIIRTVRVGRRGVPALIVWIVASLVSSFVVSTFVLPIVLLNIAGLTAGL